MNWIEAILHVDPDGGSGMLELCVLLAVLAGAWLAVARSRRGPRSRGQRSA